MKVKIIIQTKQKVSTNDPFITGSIHRSSEVWSGELDILREDEYLVKVSLIGEGEPQPLVDIPFSLGQGHYLWIPPDDFRKR